MSVVEPGGVAGTDLVTRAKNLLLQPSQEWDRIDAENPSQQSVLTGYVLPLAAIGPVCAAIGGGLIGVTMFGVTSRTPLLIAGVTAVLSFALTIVGVFIVAAIVNALAPNFKGQQNPLKAFHVAAFSGTAAWLAGVFAIIPMLGILGLLGLYSIFLFYRGLPKLMCTPAEQALPFTIVAGLISLVLQLIIGAVVATVVAALSLGAIGLGALSGGAGGSEQVVEGKLTVPGGGEIDLGRLQEAAKQMEQYSENPEAMQRAAIPVERLEALLPESLPGGFARTQVSTGEGFFGAGVGSAVGTYANGDRTIEVTIADLGPMGAMAGLAAGFQAKSSTTTADGFERMRTEGDRMISESESRSSGSAEYSVVFSGKVLVEVSGSGGVRFDEVRAAAERINPGSLL